MVKALRTSLLYGGLRQGGLQPGLGNDDIFATASLDLNFAVNKNLGTLVDATTGTNLVDFTRASSGTYVGSDGLIKTATTNQPRFDHDPTTGESLGLLVEEQRTNLLLNSGTLSTQSVTVTAVAHALSFTGTGTVTLSGASTAGPLVGTGTGEANRVSLTFTPTAGSLTLTVSGTVTNAQLEAGSFPTSYIPTEGTTVTRAADVASISGANFSSWYRQDEGTVFIEGAVPVGVISTRALLSIDDGTNAERIQIRHNGTTARAQLVVDNNTVQFSAGFVADSFPPGKYRKLAMAVKANDFAAVTDDAGTIATGTGTMPTPTQLQIGNAPGIPQPCKPIKRLTYWPARLPNETLSTITQ